jgi:uncharacterized NTF2-like protein DUF6841
MEEHEVRSWFAAYLADFVALGRGEGDDVRTLLGHYGLPLVLSTDAGTVTFSDEEHLVHSLRGQVDALRAAGYDRSEELTSTTSVVNRTCALHRAAYARLRADGTEIGRVDTTYVLTDGAAGRRITALLVHAAG